jgi:starch synthase
MQATGSTIPIFHLAAEYWPYMRVGGLGEAARGIATYQQKRGLRTTVLVPLYHPIREGGFGLEPLGEEFEVEVGPRTEVGRLWEAKEGTDGPRVLMVENHHYFDRPGVYGERGTDYPDNHRRFAFLSAAAVRSVCELVTGPAILHVHDWHTALAIVYLRTLWKGDPSADQIATVLSVHNGGFQGHFPQEMLADVGLPPELYEVAYMEWYGRANVLKGGLVFCDMATTVSPSHSFELRTEAGGFGLHHTFLALHDRLVGILNGIDYQIWNPATDPDIPANYSAADLSGKAACKAALQAEYGLPRDPTALVIGMVARLVTQKGLDLILGGRALWDAPRTQFIFLGSGERRFEEALKGAAATHPDRIALQLDFQEDREHRVIAGADALLMPSLYEPCGLTQMRAQRYGTVPIARRVGGLAETIRDGITGLLFAEYAPDQLDWTIERAVTRFSHPEAWQGMLQHAMARNFSWEWVVDQYEEVYHRALHRRHVAPAGTEASA